ncbi:MAG TPA: hypothetical protein VG820_10030, partial [Fimbriimonadaceae bacterium]|nr:hypothetical protein [Fimbriimonadaceae bacterium]
ATFGEFETAQALLERAVDREPDWYTTRLALAYSYLSGSDDHPANPDKAWQHVSKIVSSGVAYPPAYEFAGGHAEASRDFVLARQMYEKGLRAADPSSKIAARLRQAIKRLPSSG